MNAELMNKITRTIGKVGLQLKKYSPEILVVAGTVGVVASTVMACKATVKATDIVEDTKTQLDQIHNAIENPETIRGGYTEEDSKKDLTIVYVQSAVRFAKLYAPAVILGAASIACILTSNNILRKRNVALAAAYATVETGFKKYRNNVVERFGKDLDRELRYNIKKKEIEVTTVDENGEEKTEKKVVDVVDSENRPSEFAKFFDESCPAWSKDPEYNQMFVRRQQDYANEKLKAKGYLFLNDVYEMLGFQPTKAGQCVGWIYDEKCPNGDNFVDFGLYDIKQPEIYAERKRAFINGSERTVLLDFNVDGNILDLI